MKKASVIVTNWNGRELLKESVPSVIEAIKYSGVDHELIIVDDASSDGSQEFIKKNYPQVKLIALKENKGFGKANNIAVSQSKNEIIIPLNNDMSIEKDYFSSVLPNFDDETIFGVTPKMSEEDTLRNKVKIRTSSWAKFKFGFWQDIDNINLKDRKGRYISLTALGGGAAFDRKKFLSLGGFDKLYYPVYYEDTDLCYQAWKRGWKIIYEPGTTVHHWCSRTITTQHGRKCASLIKKKNYYLFIWKNITDHSLILQHLFFLPLSLLNKLLSGRVMWIKAFFLALKQLKGSLVQRRKVKKESILSDREVLGLLGGKHGIKVE